MNALLCDTTKMTPFIQGKKYHQITPFIPHRSPYITQKVYTTNIQTHMNIVININYFRTSRILKFNESPFSLRYSRYLIALSYQRVPFCYVITTDNFIKNVISQKRDYVVLYLARHRPC